MKICYNPYRFTLCVSERMKMIRLQSNIHENGKINKVSKNAKHILKITSVLRKKKTLYHVLAYTYSMFTVRLHFTLIKILIVNNEHDILNAVSLKCDVNDHCSG